MGKITLTVEGTTVGTVVGGGGIVIEKTVSEEDSTRLVMAYAATYADKFVDGDGNPRAPSPQEVIEQWFDGMVAGSTNHVASFERQTAAKTASDAVTDISVI